MLPSGCLSGWQRPWGWQPGSAATHGLRGQQRVPEFSNDFADPQENIGEVTVYLLFGSIPSPPPRDRSGSGFGRAAGLFRFLSVTLDRTRLQFSSVRMISPNEKEKPFKTHFYR